MAREAATAPGAEKEAAPIDAAAPCWQRRWRRRTHKPTGPAEAMCTAVVTRPFHRRRAPPFPRNTDRPYSIDVTERVHDRTTTKNDRHCLPVVQHAHDLGVKVLVAHEGLPLVNLDPAFNHPDDIVAVSRLFPDMQFVVFHGAWDPSRREGLYDPTATIGIKTPLAASIVTPCRQTRTSGPTSGQAWPAGAPPAQTGLGGWRRELLAWVGANGVLWGTDARLVGLPQPSQIVAFRAFQITLKYQDRFGYPALSDTLKRQGFGLNAAALFHVDPTVTRAG